MSTFRIVIDEHKSFKNQLFKLAKSDLIKTYRGAALGWAWAIVKPMITIFVFWFAFTVGLRVGKTQSGYPYVLWLIAGYLPWFYMSEMISQGSSCIRKYHYLVTKMKFPISVIPTYVGISKLYVHFALLGVTILMFVIFGYYPDVYYLQIPIYMMMMFVFFVVWSLFAGMLSGLSKDFQNFVNACTTALFWMSGIVYDVETIHNPNIRLLLKFNPVTVIATGYRNSFVDKKWFFEDPASLLCFTITLIFFFVLAMWAFKRLRKEIPDVL